MFGVVRFFLLSHWIPDLKHAGICSLNLAFYFSLSLSLTLFPVNRPLGVGVIYDVNVLSYILVFRLTHAGQTFRFSNCKVYASR